MNHRTDLNLGDAVYISVILHTPASETHLLNGYEFIFDVVILQTSLSYRFNCTTATL